MITMMTRKSKLVSLLAGTTLALITSGASAQVMGRSKYVQANLVSDITVTPPATTQDAHLKNAWGVAFVPGGPMWINDNGTGVATLYDGAGIAQPAGSPLIVTIPQPAVPTGPNSSPTGMVWNGNPFSFVVPTTTAGALFIFASEDGTTGSSGV